MRPNRSVEMPPTNPVAAPSRAAPTAMLRHEPPTTGTMASRPSVDFTGRKSIRASPQLNSMVSIFRQKRRSDAARASHRGFPDPVGASVHGPAASSGGSRPFPARSARSASRSPTSRPWPRRSIRYRPPATAPSIAAPSRTGSWVSGRATVRPVVSAMICRTSELRPAPPPITIRLLSTPCDRKTSTTSARP